MALRPRMLWLGRSVERQVVEAAKVGLEQTAAACHYRAAQRAPVRTGALRNSVFHREPRIEGPGIVSVEWGASATYTAYVELGTSRTKAQPFIRPAMDEEYPRLAGRIKAAL